MWYNSKEEMKNIILEKVLHILSLSNLHKNMSFKDIKRLIIPPLKLGQYRIYEDKEVPLCFASWGMLSDIASEGFKNRTRLLQAEDWNSGDNLWLITVVCPFGGARKAMKRLEEMRIEQGLPSKINFRKNTKDKVRFSNVERI